MRGALWVTLAVLLATATALTLQYVRTFSVLEAESRHMVQAEVAGLMERYRSGGLEELAQFIARPQPPADARDYIYLIGTASGRVVAGDLDRWPSAAQRQGWQILNIPFRSGPTLRVRRVEAEVVSLGSGNRLLVGHLADGRDQLGVRYLETLGWSIAATALIGLALGWWISRRALRFVEHAAEAGERFLAGRLDERLPVTGRGDQYDHLAQVVNACFGEVERMIGSLRAATDGLAHDLKTPLTRMKVRAELALLRQSPADEQFLVATTRDVDALLKLINDLLALAHVDALTPNMLEPLDLADVAREALELYEPVIEAAGRHLIADLRPATTRGARSLLVQAVCNLIDNAMKYAADSPIQVTTGHSRAEAEIKVSDAGPGIAAGERSRATERLVRLDASRSTEGSGLGLSIVAAVARAHGGALALEDNHPGLNASIRLPSGATPKRCLGPEITHLSLLRHGDASISR